MGRYYIDTVGSSGVYGKIMKIYVRLEQVHLRKCSQMQAVYLVPVPIVVVMYGGGGGIFIIPYAWEPTIRGRSSGYSRRPLNKFNRHPKQIGTQLTLKVIALI